MTSIKRGCCRADLAASLVPERVSVSWSSSGEARTNDAAHRAPEHGSARRDAVSLRRRHDRPRHRPDPPAPERAAPLRAVHALCARLRAARRARHWADPAAGRLPLRLGRCAGGARPGAARRADHQPRDRRHRRRGRVAGQGHPLPHASGEPALYLRGADRLLRPRQQPRARLGIPGARGHPRLATRRRHPHRGGGPRRSRGRRAGGHRAPGQRSSARLRIRHGKLRSPGRLGCAQGPPGRRAS